MQSSASAAVCGSATVGDPSSRRISFILTRRGSLGLQELCTAWVGTARSIHGTWIYPDGSGSSVTERASADRRKTGAVSESAVHSNDWFEEATQVTHTIVTELLPARFEIAHGARLLCAIATGHWILRASYLRASASAGCWLDNEIDHEWAASLESLSDAERSVASAARWWRESLQSGRCKRLLQDLRVYLLCPAVNGASNESRGRTCASWMVAVASNARAVAAIVRATGAELCGVGSTCTASDHSIDVVVEVYSENGQNRIPPNTSCLEMQQGRWLSALDIVVGLIGCADEQLRFAQLRTTRNIPGSESHHATNSCRFGSSGGENSTCVSALAWTETATSTKNEAVPSSDPLPSAGRLRQSPGERRESSEAPAPATVLAAQRAECLQQRPSGALSGTLSPDGSVLESACHDDDALGEVRHGVGAQRLPSNSLLSQDETHAVTLKHPDTTGNTGIFTSYGSTPVASSNNSSSGSSTRSARIVATEFAAAHALGESQSRGSGEIALLPAADSGTLTALEDEAPLEQLSGIRRDGITRQDPDNSCSASFTRVLGTLSEDNRSCAPLSDHSPSGSIENACWPPYRQTPDDAAADGSASPFDEFDLKGLWQARERATAALPAHGTRTLSPRKRQRIHQSIETHDGTSRCTTRRVLFGSIASPTTPEGVASHSVEVQTAGASSHRALPESRARVETRVESPERIPVDSKASPRSSLDCDDVSTSSSPMMASVCGKRIKHEPCSWQETRSPGTTPKTDTRVTDASTATKLETGSISSPDAKFGTYGSAAWDAVQPLPRTHLEKRVSPGPPRRQAPALSPKFHVAASDAPSVLNLSHLLDLIQEFESAVQRDTNEWRRAVLTLGYSRATKAPLFLRVAARNLRRLRLLMESGCVRVPMSYGRRLWYDSGATDAHRLQAASWLSFDDAAWCLRRSSLLPPRDMGQFRERLVQSARIRARGRSELHRLEPVQAIVGLARVPHRQLLRLAPDAQRRVHTLRRVVSRQWTREAVASWSEAALKAWRDRHENANAYYYRHTDPGEFEGEETQSLHTWTPAERRLFFAELDRWRANQWRLGTCWGIFSKAIPSRCGYQCSNFYRACIRSGEIHDPTYGFNARGELKRLYPEREDPNTRAPPDALNCLSEVWQWPEIQSMERQVDTWIRELHPSLALNANWYRQQRPAGEPQRRNVRAASGGQRQARSIRRSLPATHIDLLGSYPDAYITTTDAAYEEADVRHRRERRLAYRSASVASTGCCVVAPAPDQRRLESRTGSRQTLRSRSQAETPELAFVEVDGGALMEVMQAPAADPVAVPRRRRLRRLASPESDLVDQDAFGVDDARCPTAASPESHNATAMRYQQRPNRIVLEAEHAGTSLGAPSGQRSDRCNANLDKVAIGVVRSMRSMTARRQRLESILERIRAGKASTRGPAPAPVHSLLQASMSDGKEASLSGSTSPVHEAPDWRVQRLRHLVGAADQPQRTALLPALEASTGAVGGTSQRLPAPLATAEGHSGRKRRQPQRLLIAGQTAATTTTTGAAAAAAAMNASGAIVPPMETETRSAQRSAVAQHCYTEQIVQETGNDLPGDEGDAAHQRTSRFWAHQHQQRSPASIVPAFRASKQQTRLPEWRPQTLSDHLLRLCRLLDLSSSSSSLSNAWCDNALGLPPAGVPLERATLAHPECFDAGRSHPLPLIVAERSTVTAAGTRSQATDSWNAADAFIDGLDGVDASSSLLQQDSAPPATATDAAGRSRYAGDNPDSSFYAAWSGYLNQMLQRILQRRCGDAPADPHAETNVSGAWNAHDEHASGTGASQAWSCSLSTRDTSCQFTLWPMLQTLLERLANDVVLLYTDADPVLGQWLRQSGSRSADGQEGAEPALPHLIQLVMRLTALHADTQVVVAAHSLATCVHEALDGTSASSSGICCARDALWIAVAVGLERASAAHVRLPTLPLTIPQTIPVTAANAAESVNEQANAQQQLRSALRLFCWHLLCSEALHCAPVLLTSPMCWRLGASALAESLQGWRTLRQECTSSSSSSGSATLTMPALAALLARWHERVLACCTRHWRQVVNAACTHHAGGFSLDTCAPLLEQALHLGAEAATWIAFPLATTTNAETTLGHAAQRRLGRHDWRLQAQALDEWATQLMRPFSPESDALGCTVLRPAAAAAAAAAAADYDGNHNDVHDDHGTPASLQNICNVDSSTAVVALAGVPNAWHSNTLGAPFSQPSTSVDGFYVQGAAALSAPVALGALFGVLRSALEMLAVWRTSCWQRFITNASSPVAACSVVVDDANATHAGARLLASTLERRWLQLLRASLARLWQVSGPADDTAGDGVCHWIDRSYGPYVFYLYGTALLAQMLPDPERQALYRQVRHRCPNWILPTLLRLHGAFMIWCCTRVRFLETSQHAASSANETAMASPGSATPPLLLLLLHGLVHVHATEWVTLSQQLLRWLETAGAAPAGLLPSAGMAYASERAPLPAVLAQRVLAQRLETNRVMLGQIPALDHVTAWVERCVASSSNSSSSSSNSSTNNTIPSVGKCAIGASTWTCWETLWQALPWYWTWLTRVLENAALGSSGSTAPSTRYAITPALSMVTSGVVVRVARFIQVVLASALLERTPCAESAGAQSDDARDPPRDPDAWIWAPEMTATTTVDWWAAHTQRALLLHAIGPSSERLAAFLELVLPQNQSGAAGNSTGLLWFVPASLQEAHAHLVADMVRLLHQVEGAATVHRFLTRLTPLLGGRSEYLESWTGIRACQRRWSIGFLTRLVFLAKLQEPVRIPGNVHAPRGVSASEIHCCGSDECSETADAYGALGESSANALCSDQEAALRLAAALQHLLTQTLLHGLVASPLLWASEQAGARERPASRLWSSMEPLVRALCQSGDVEDEDAGAAAAAAMPSWPLFLARYAARFCNGLVRHPATSVATSTTIAAAAPLTHVRHLWLPLLARLRQLVPTASAATVNSETSWRRHQVSTLLAKLVDELEALLTSALAWNHMWLQGRRAAVTGDETPALSRAALQLFQYLVEFAGILLVLCARLLRVPGRAPFWSRVIRLGRRALEEYANIVAGQRRQLLQTETSYAPGRSRSLEHLRCVWIATVLRGLAQMDLVPNDSYYASFRRHLIAASLAQDALDALVLGLWPGLSPTLLQQPVGESTAARSERPAVGACVRESDAAAEATALLALLDWYCRPETLFPAGTAALQRLERFQQEWLSDLCSRCLAQAQSERCVNLLQRWLQGRLLTCTRQSCLSHLSGAVYYATMARTLAVAWWSGCMRHVAVRLNHAGSPSMTTMTMTTTTPEQQQQQQQQHRAALRPADRVATEVISDQCSGRRFAQRFRNSVDLAAALMEWLAASTRVDAPAQATCEETLALLLEALAAHVSAGSCPHCGDDPSPASISSDERVQLLRRRLAEQRARSACAAVHAVWTNHLERLARKEAMDAKLFTHPSCCRNWLVIQVNDVVERAACWRRRPGDIWRTAGPSVFDGMKDATTTTRTPPPWLCWSVPER